MVEPSSALRHTPLQVTPRLVYVLENDRISCVITELIVKKNLLGGEVRCFPNGQRALDELATAAQTGTGLPDLILLDLDMPLMDGWEFLNELSHQPAAAGICVFVLTSSINPDDLTRATSYQAVQGFFTKPLDEDGVVRMQVLLQHLREQALVAASTAIVEALATTNNGQTRQLGPEPNESQRHCA